MKALCSSRTCNSFDAFTIDRRPIDVVMIRFVFINSLFISSVSLNIVANLQLLRKRVPQDLRSCTVFDHQNKETQLPWQPQSASPLALFRTCECNLQLMQGHSRPNHQIWEPRDRDQAATSVQMLHLLKIPHIIFSMKISVKKNTSEPIIIWGIKYEISAD